jgi:preprotein translocase subunit SecG
MWIPSLNAIGLIVIGIGILITVLIKKRKADTTEVTVLGAENSLQLSRAKLTLLLGSILVISGLVLGYLEYHSETNGRIEVRNIEIIEAAVKQIKAADDTTLDKVSFISSFQSNLDNDVLVKQINDEVALADDYLYREDRLWNKDNDLAILNGEPEGKSSIVIELMKVYSWYNPKGAEYSLLEQKYGEYLLNIFDSEEEVRRFFLDWRFTCFLLGEQRI